MDKRVKYILVYRINDFAEMGGGIEYRLFETLGGIVEYVNQMAQDARFEIEFSGRLLNPIKFNPVEIVTKWEVEE